jgi:signal transduction histidine kinase
LAVGTGSVSILAALGMLLAYADTQEELDSLAKEEFEELVEMFRPLAGTRADFQAATDELRTMHPDASMAWRVWNRTDGSVWGSFGPPESLAGIPLERGVAPEVGVFSRWLEAPLTDELELGYLLEGVRERAYARRFLMVALSTVAGAIAVSYFAGRFLGRRIGESLQRIAEEARASVRGPRPALEASLLPEEVRDVVEALREAFAQVRGESDKARLLASGLAHELRSPLQSLLMQAEVALLREREGPDYRAALSKQVLDLQELIRTVDNLVTLCAPPEARRTRSGEEFDLAAEARLRLRREEERASSEGVQMRMILPETLGFRGDREGLMLALRNLVANAIDWSPPGGWVEVRIQPEADGVGIQVDDQGPGVPEVDRERIFLPFEQSGTKPSGRIGYGLGLALVRTVTELHQGTIRVATSRLGGAAFRLELPQSRAAAP